MKPADDAVELSCRDATEQASAFLAQRLPTLAQARFEQHLHACTWCMTYLAQLRTTLGMLRRVGESAGPPAGRDKLAAVFRRWKEGR